MSWLYLKKKSLGFFFASNRLQSCNIVKKIFLQIDCENDLDPFDITPHTYTPVGVSFVTRDDSERKQKANYNKSDLLDEKGSNIGYLCSSFEITTKTPRTKSVSITFFNT